MKEILVIDDSTTAKLLFKACMPQGLDYEIHEANNLKTALQKAKEVALDIVVTDYNMPAQNGIEIVMSMQEAGIRTRFVLVTANTQQSVINAARVAGFSSIVEKPVSKEKITTMLKETL